MHTQKSNLEQTIYLYFTAIFYFLNTHPSADLSPLTIRDKVGAKCQWKVCKSRKPLMCKDLGGGVWGRRSAPLFDFHANFRRKDLCPFVH